MKHLELLCQVYNRGIFVDTWEPVTQVGIVHGDPVVRRPDGMLEVISDHDRLREATDQKNSS